ncbi:MAG: hypothetical protein ABJV68_31955 [Paracoccaceae bacterium]
MKKIVLIALLATTVPITAYAGSSVLCTGNSNGSWSCTYTYAW